MKPCLTLFLASALIISTSPCAQSLPHGVIIQAVNATQQANNQWVITSQVTNHRNTPITGLSVVYALYDTQGKEIGRVSSQRDTALSSGDTWLANATTAVPFARVSAKEIKETSGQP